MGVIRAYRHHLIKHKLYKRTLCLFFFWQRVRHSEHLLNRHQAPRKTFVPLAQKHCQCASSKTSREKSSDVLARCSGEAQRVEGAGPVSRINPVGVCVCVSRLDRGSCSFVPASASKCFFVSRALYNHGSIVHSVFHAHSQMYTQYYSLRTQRKRNSSSRREALRWNRRGRNQPQDTTNHILQFHGFSFFVYFIQTLSAFFTREEVHDCGKKNKNKKKLSNTACIGAKMTT